MVLSACALATLVLSAVVLARARDSGANGANEILGDAFTAPMATATATATAGLSASGCEITFKPEYASFAVCHSPWPNAGDLLAPAVTRAVLEEHFGGGCSGENIPHSGPTRSSSSSGLKCLWSIGSLMEYVRSGDHVWGLGLWHERALAGKHAEHLDFTIHGGVRGPETARVLNGVYGDARVQALGDPGFLVGSLFASKFKPTHEHKCFIPHVNSDLTRAPEGVVTFSPGKYGMTWEPWVADIVKCSHVYSSSLHGLILADAFGIPARWFFPSNQRVVEHESQFKYLDWLETSGRGAQWRSPATNIQDMLDESTYAPALTPQARSALASKIKAAFPFEMFQVTKSGG